jgi:hypothetical protein
MGSGLENYGSNPNVGAALNLGKKYVPINFCKNGLRYSLGAWVKKHLVSLGSTSQTLISYPFFLKKWSKLPHLV